MKATTKNQQSIFTEKKSLRLFSSIVSNIYFLAILFSIAIFLSGCGDENSNIADNGGTILSTADPTPPVNTSTDRVINNGAATTNIKEAYLTISATDAVGVTGYCAREIDAATPLLSDLCWKDIVSTQSYIATVPFTLTSERWNKRCLYLVQGW